jgi:hypothetical protein
MLTMNTVINELVQWWSFVVQWWNGFSAQIVPRWNLLIRFLLENYLATVSVSFAVAILACFMLRSIMMGSWDGRGPVLLTVFLFLVASAGLVFTFYEVGRALIAEEVGDRWKTTEGGRLRFRRGRKDRSDFSGSLIQLCL